MLDERELLLLGLLKREEMHGYQLNQFLEHQLGSVVPMKRSTAYFLLNRLSTRSLVHEEKDREGRRPERRVYRLTPDGETAFAESLREHLARHSAAHYPDVVGLLFMDFLPAEERVDLLRHRLEEMEEQAISAEEQVRAHTATRVRFAMSYRASVLRAERDWLRSTIDELSAAPEPVDTVLSGGSSA